MSLRSLCARLHNVVFWAGAKGVFGVYLLVIFVWSLLYYCAGGGSFYAPYARYEPSGLQDAANIEDAIAAQLQKNAIETAKDPKLWLVRPYFLRVTGLRADENRSYTFDVHITARKGYPHTTAAIGTVYHYKIDLNGRMWTPETYRTPCRFVQYDAPKFDPFMDEITRQIFQTSGPCAGRPSLNFTEQDDKRLFTYYQGLQGDPKFISGWWLRCLYLSATTITTTGFGDIVPLTPTMRALTGVEAIFGWIISGIFISVLAITAPWKKKKV